MKYPCLHIFITIEEIPKERGYVIISIKQNAADLIG